MKLLVGDRVRVHFYPPKSTRSFVEGIVDRNEISTFRGLGFSLQTTREVVLGHEISTPRSLPYIIAYVKEDDFEGRIEVLKTAAEPVIEAVSGAEADHTPQTEPVEIAEEPDLLLEMQVEAEVQPEPQKQGWRRLFNRAA
jgi:hypothetical protein